MANWTRADKIGLWAFGLILTAIVALALIGIPHSGPPKDIGQQVAKTSQTDEKEHDGPPGPIGSDVSFLGDGAAQWLMAILTIVATGISWWAVTLVRDTLALNRAAVNAAVSANNQARELFVAENRPWLKVVRVGLTGFNLEDEPMRTMIEVSVKNVGSSPALNIEAGIEIVRSKLPLMFSAGVQEFAERLVLGSRQGWTNRGCFPGDDAKLYTEEIDPEDRNVYILIAITYRNALAPDEVFHTAFAVRFYGKRKIGIDQGAFSMS